MRSWTRTVRGIWRSGLRAEALALLSAPREERAPDPLGRFGRGEGLLDVKERGEQDARDRLSIFYAPVSWRPARRFLTKVLQFLSAVGSPKPDLACQSFRPLHRSDAPAFSRSASSLNGSPAVVRQNQRPEKARQGTTRPP